MRLTLEASSDSPLLTEALEATVGVASVAAGSSSLHPPNKAWTSTKHSFIRACPRREESHKRTCGNIFGATHLTSSLSSRTAFGERALILAAALRPPFLSATGGFSLFRLGAFSTNEISPCCTRALSLRIKSPWRRSQRKRGVASTHLSLRSCNCPHGNQVRPQSRTSGRRNMP